MEKHPVKQQKRCCNRLLILILLNLAVLPLWSKSLSKAQIRALEIVPDTKEFFTAQENGYTVCFEGIESSEIHTDLPALPAGVQFISSKRSVYISDEGERGTMVKLWFSFTDPGPVKLPPLIVVIGRGTYYIPFGEVTVYENPALINPCLEVDFGKNVSVSESRSGTRTVNIRTGEKLNFTVSIKYCVQILDYSWKLPEDSIFRETKRHDIVNGTERRTEFSSEKYPVAEFEWQPLVPGTYDLPQLEIKALAYNGAQRLVYMPDYKINVTGRTVTERENKIIPLEGIYSDAFARGESGNSLTAADKITPEDCIRIRDLRSAERHQMFWESARSERRQFEEKVGISDEENEPGVPEMYFYFICFGSAFAAVLIFFALKRYKLSVITFVASTVLFVIAVSVRIKVSEEYVIYKGGDVYPVPEVMTSNYRHVNGGVRMQVLNEAGDWLYVHSANIDGWIHKEDVLKIE